jgi:hypothetical protein
MKILKYSAQLVLFMDLITETCRPIGKGKRGAIHPWLTHVVVCLVDSYKSYEY